MNLMKDYTLNKIEVVYTWFRMNVTYLAGDREVDEPSLLAK